MKVLHLTSSRFHGGPERQMLGLAEAGRNKFETVFASFSEGHLCLEFLSRVSASGFGATELVHDTPHLLRARNEVRKILRKEKISVLLCHGYKAGLIGWWAARNAGIPVVAVSRGWTGENRKVRFYEWLDRKVLKRMDRVVCVSQAQADKVRICGVKSHKIIVIPNSIDTSRFEKVDPAGRPALEKLFDWRPRLIIGAAGRLSPEKGFDLLVTAARTVVDQNQEIGFVLFGEGNLRQSLSDQIHKAQLKRHFVLAGHRPDIDFLFPHLDLFVQSSHTEGMPNVILESLGAGVPVVATDVGGTREIIDAKLNCRLLPAGSVDALHSAITEAVTGQFLPEQRKALQTHISEHFDFDVQATRYLELWNDLLSRSCGHRPTATVDQHSEKAVESRG